jgi:hypothetical protein
MGLISRALTSLAPPGATSSPVDPTGPTRRWWTVASYPRSEDELVRAGCFVPKRDVALVACMRKLIVILNTLIARRQK